ncbi:hypothetical protein FHG87_025081, partial [Trinorchestia longiramus]
RERSRRKEEGRGIAQGGEKDTGGGGIGVEGARRRGIRKGERTEGRGIAGGRERDTGGGERDTGGGGGRDTGGGGGRDTGGGGGRDTGGGRISSSGADQQAAQAVPLEAPSTFISGVLHPMSTDQ